MKILNKLDKLALALLLTIIATFAQAENYEEGISYQRIVPEQPTSTTGKIEVAELFWYGCPHCHKFEPFIDRWLETKPANVEFVRVPAILQPHWEIHARAFYAAEALGVADKIHTPLFNAIHAHKRKLDTEEELAKFFEEQGVKKEDFQKAMHSFSVDAKVRRAGELGRRYGVTGTPSVIVNGKYRVDGQICKCGFAEILNIVNFLAEKESATKTN